MFKTFLIFDKTCFVLVLNFFGIILKHLKMFLKKIDYCFCKKTVCCLLNWLVWQQMNSHF
mgnify:CR=1 FL=1